MDSRLEGHSGPSIHHFPPQMGSHSNMLYTSPRMPFHLTRTHDLLNSLDHTTHVHHTPITQRTQDLQLRNPENKNQTSHPIPPSTHHLPHPPTPEPPTKEPRSLYSPLRIHLIPSLPHPTPKPPYRNPNPHPPQPPFF